MKKILLIITGSIAAYKSLDLIRLLRKGNYQVTPIMTSGAEEFVTPLLVNAIANQEVHQDLFAVNEEGGMGHIEFSRKNDLIIVAPATADIIAKMAHGIADDLSSATLLASNKPIFVAPAMNKEMWTNLQTQKNITSIRENGIKILAPQTDTLACGEFGVGKMIDPPKIFATIENYFAKQNKFSGKKIIITAGATYEPIDPVRFVGNYSSGKQGIAIAQILYNMGAEVTLILANSQETIDLPLDNIIRVKTADQMLKAAQDNIKKTDIFISAAAVADFKPKNISPEKIKKSSNDINQLKNLELVENVDILKTISCSKNNRPKIVIGFAAESKNLIDNAKIKLKEKKCDFIIANDIKDGDVFGSNYNQISIISKDNKIESLSKMSKIEIADNLTERLLAILTSF